MLKCFETFCHKLGQVVPFFLHSHHLDEAKELITKLQTWVDEVSAVAEVVPPISKPVHEVDAVVDTAAGAVKSALGGSNP